MRLICLGSSSKGNSYILQGDNDSLIIEAGISFMEAKKRLSFDISKIEGVLCTHQHMDHAKYIKEYMTAGITVLSSEEVFNSQNISLSHNRARVIIPEKGYKIGHFKVIPFLVEHDVVTYGFHINHPEMGNVLFITDTYLLPYHFEGLNQIIIECNYSDAILEHNIIYKGLNPLMRPRLLYSHMELETCKNVLRSLDLSQVVNIVLIHLSDGNSNEAQFVSEIESEFGKNVIAGNKEVEIEFNINPY
jgi:phosphoribosyl 1,2-cyclic phosphodiesterase